MAKKLVLRQTLQNLFNCATEKAIKIKKELQTANLLKQIQMGFNPKTKKNEPNRLYLSKLDVTATDVYLRGEHAQKEPQSLGTSGISKIESPHKSVDNTPQTVATSGISKIENNLDLERSDRDKDRYLIDTPELDFSTANYSPAEIEQQNRDLIENAYHFLTHSETNDIFLEPEAVKLISFWARTPQQMRRFIKIILNAKYKVEQEHRDIGVYIILDDPELKPLMTQTLRRYFNVLRSNEKHVKNVENYLYGTMQNLFGNFWNKKAAERYHREHPEAPTTTEDDPLSFYD